METINLKCPVCSADVEQVVHVGVRTTQDAELSSGLYAQAKPCGHPLGKSLLPTKTTQGNLAVYNGGPLFQQAWSWVNVYWGSYWNTAALPFGVADVDKAVSDIATDPSYVGGLSEYNVGIGSLTSSVIVKNSPPGTIDDSAIQAQLQTWISDGTLPDLGGKGIYNIFFPPGTVVTLQGMSSCTQFCDYHSAVGNNGPFYTVEPYPCVSGCNQCTSAPLDTLTQGLSEEMVEAATDLNPGTGWVIGNEELCDYCDASFNCNQISTGEFVNAWYSNKQGGCWSASGVPPPPPPPGTQCVAQIELGIEEIVSGQEVQGIDDLVGGIECLFAAGVLDVRKALKIGKVFVGAAEKKLGDTNRVTREIELRIGEVEKKLKI